MNIYISYLSDFEPRDVQENAIKKILACENLDLSPLLQPLSRKDCWENCAIIFTSLDIENMEKYLPRLLEWLKDLNWPGAFIILDKLKSIDRNILKIPVEQAVTNAAWDNDEIWLENLAMISGAKN